MVQYDDVSESKSFVFQVDGTLDENLSNVVKSIKAKGSFNTTVTVKDVAGIKGLSISSTESESVASKVNSIQRIQYERKICDDFSFKTGARYADGKITLDAMITNSIGFGIGFEGIATLNLSELQKNGLFLVTSIPVFGMQVIVKYNIVTQQVVLQLRVPLPDGNSDDKDDAAECGCNVIYNTVDVIRATVTPSKVYEYNSVVNTHQVNSYQTNQNYNTTYRNTHTQDNSPGLISNVIDGIGNGVNAIADGIASLFTSNRTNVHYN